VKIILVIILRCQMSIMLVTLLMTSNEYNVGNAVVVSNEELVILLRREVKTMLAIQLQRGTCDRN
jgi:hypothetical protein